MNEPQLRAALQEINITPPESTTQEVDVVERTESIQALRNLLLANNKKGKLAGAPSRSSNICLFVFPRLRLSLSRCLSDSPWRRLPLSLSMSVCLSLSVSLSPFRNSGQR